MVFLFRRKQYDPYILDDIENKIIELDNFEDLPTNESETLCKNDEESFNENSFKQLHEKVVKGIAIMAIGSSCFCFGILCILYKLL